MNVREDPHSPFACLLVGQPTLRRRIKVRVLAAFAADKTIVDESSAAPPSPK